MAAPEDVKGGWFIELSGSWRECWQEEGEVGAGRGEEAVKGERGEEGVKGVKGGGGRRRGGSCKT